jgi:ribosomal protein S18 acetylase RimI-like enzyme
LPPFQLRSASEGDLELAYEITKDSMREYVVETWGVWNEDEQREKHRMNFTPATLRIIISSGVPIGLVAVEEEPSYLWLVKLYIQPTFQRSGIGTALLRQVISEAKEIGKPVRLRVLRVNIGAQRLYLRHGFKVVGEEPERFFMVRDASVA